MSKTRLTVKNNGSLLVEGDFVIQDIEGNEYTIGERNKISLCRCGLSKIKPFCDGSHKGFFDHLVKVFDFDEEKKKLAKGD